MSEPLRAPQEEDAEGPTRRLLANPLNDGVFLLVQHLLFRLREVATVPARHRALFGPDLPIIVAHRCGLRVGELAFLHFLVNAFALVRNAVIHLIATRVTLVPTCRRQR